MSSIWDSYPDRPDPTPEGQKFVDESELLANTDWQLRAQTEADAYIETGDIGDLSNLLGAAAFSVRQIEARRHVGELERQFRLPS